MFGYERGSFTGALAKGKRGLVEAADNGVLFLDEVGEIPLPLQAKMLQFVEDGGVQRVGGTQMRRLRVQVISATNRDLAKMVAEGSFRKDLYYRLGVVTLRLPPLRDCPNLVDELIDRTCDDVGRRRGSPLKLDRACRQMLRLHTFPGNVRELQNVIEHLAVVCGATVRQDDVRGAIDRGPEPDLGGPAFVADSGEALRVAVRRYEGRLILDAIARTGSKRKAAEMLGVDVATVIRKSRRAEN
jgi:transcriptional regulator with PAS, ATPase and Fis domain